MQHRQPDERTITLADSGIVRDALVSRCSNLRL